MKWHYALPGITALALGGLVACRLEAGMFKGFSVHNLVSDVATIPADHTDANLVNPWGIVFNPTGPMWVANNGTQTSTAYDGNGVAQPLIVHIPAGSNGDADPTGIVYNSSSDFVVSQGGISAPAKLLFDGEGGTIVGWTPAVSADAVIAYDDGTVGAVYKGLAMASDGGSNFLYASDFHNNKVDVFDHNFSKVTTHGNFKDPGLPSDYAPFGIQNIQGKLIVTFAKKVPGSDDEEAGAGLGYVDSFDAEGNLIKHLISNGALNAPWGIALAPAPFGKFSNKLLIGNFGDGTINAFNPDSGHFMGTLKITSGEPIVIPGLWGISFGNGFHNQPTNTLFFAAGINDEANGVYGRIDPIVASPPAP